MSTKESPAPPESTRQLASDLAYAIFGQPMPGDPGSLAEIIEGILSEHELYIPVPQEPEDFCALAGDCRECSHPDNCICEHHAARVHPSSESDADELISRGAARIAIDNLKIVIGSHNAAGYEERCAHNEGVEKALEVVEGLPELGNPASAIGADEWLPIDHSIAIYAFRYCLGRRTYAVAECVKYLVGNWERFESIERIQIQNDIRKHYKRINKPIDVDWLRVLALETAPQSEIKEK